MRILGISLKNARYRQSFLGLLPRIGMGKRKREEQNDALSPIDFLPERPYTMKTGVKKKCLGKVRRTSDSS